MSADNRICIMQYLFGNWAVWHGSASCDYSEPPHEARVFESKNEAEEYAWKCEEEMGGTEYGVECISEDEQMNGLCMEIADIGKRMKNLRECGHQWR